MTELQQQRDAIIKLLVIILLACLYSMGGMYGTWIRRFLMPVVFTAFCLVYNKSAKHIFILPFLCLSLTIGYGSDIVYIKVLKRLLFGFCTSLSFGSFMLLNKKWLLATLNILIVTGSFIVMGVWGINNARVEETTLGLLLCLIPIMYLPKEEQNG